MVQSLTTLGEQVCLGKFLDLSLIQTGFCMFNRDCRVRSFVLLIQISATIAFTRHSHVISRASLGSTICKSPAEEGTYTLTGNTYSYASLRHRVRRSSCFCSPHPTVGSLLLLPCKPAIIAIFVSACKRKQTYTAGPQTPQTSSEA
jgi:hypothetical protein